MSTIRRTTLGNLALILFVAFLLQVVMATGGLVGDARATGTALTPQDATLSKTGDNWVHVTVRLWPITNPDFASRWELVLNFPGLGPDATITLGPFSVADAVYTAVYDEVYATVYASAKVYANVYTNVYEMLLELQYLLTPGVYVGPGYYVEFREPQWDSAGKTVYLTGVFRPPPEAPPVTPVPTTVPTDTGVLRIDPTRDEAVLRVDPAKVETLLKDPEVTEVRLGIPPTVSTATMAVDIPPATVTGSQTYEKPLVAELGAVGQVELKPGAVTAEDLKYKDEQGVERQGNLRIAASRLSQDEAAPLLAKADRSQFGNQQPVAQVYEVQAQVVADGKVVGTARPKKPLVLVLTFDKGKVEASGAPVEATMIYVWNEATGTWDPCATKVDPVTGKASTVRPTLSKYTVMAYRRTFADVAGHWAQRDIEIMAGRFVARGVTPTTFLPNGKVTRAQFAAFLQRALGIPEEKPAQPTFSDVAPDAWYYGAVEAAAKAGLVLGWQGKFRPDDLVTREEMATMVVRGIAYDGKKVTLTGQEVEELLARFSDRNSISDWARENAATAVKAGIVLGRAVDSDSPVYAPRDDAMRAEAVTMIKRLLKYLGWF